MTNFKYFQITKTRKIRYLRYIKKNTTYIVFLHGFMSDLEGKKPKAFLNFAKKNNLGFLHLSILVMENLQVNLLMVTYLNGAKTQKF